MEGLLPADPPSMSWWTSPVSRLVTRSGLHSWETNQYTQYMRIVLAIIHIPAIYLLGRDCCSAERSNYWSSFQGIQHAGSLSCLSGPLDISIWSFQG